MKIPGETLGLAAEYATASELCRRGIYAQLTLGQRKRTDILVDTGTNMLRVQVKGKQYKEWGWITGVFGEGIVLVFADFGNRGELERPDFYVLTPADWEELLTKELRLTGRVARDEFTINEENVPFYKSGKPGMSIRPTQIEEHREQWHKIIAILEKETSLRAI